MSDISGAQGTFSALGLPGFVLRNLEQAGYVNPTPIQAEVIPLVRDGRDVIGQAKTGTGKTAAFALPLLERIDVEAGHPQVLVLAPTRELANQVAKAFETYGRGLDGLRVAAIYGGADMRAQLKQLKAGAQVVVGTPGRVIDHIERRSLRLETIECVVLDEADEMLRMGFVDDVEWILSHAPEERQVALFSATMPPPIRRIAERYLREPQQVVVKSKTTTADTIRQRVCRVPAAQRVDALARILEGPTVDKALVFVRTRAATTELAEKLYAYGLRCAPLNGDIVQRQRERTVARFKEGRVKVIIATDVAARGLHVDGISHVVNFDPAGDVETYVHRIGRTGRAGQSGEAILFVGPRERRLITQIERVTKSTLEEMAIPRAEELNQQRIEGFKEEIRERIAKGGLEILEEIAHTLWEEEGIPPTLTAAALGAMARGERPLLLEDLPEVRAPKRRERSDHQGPAGKDSRPRDRAPAPRGRPGQGRDSDRNEEGMEAYRVSLGADHGIKHGNIVGAIANETGLRGQQIGRINIEADHSTVDLPNDLSAAVLKRLGKVRIFGQPCHIESVTARPRPASRKPARRKPTPARGPARKKTKATKPRRQKV